MNTYLAKGHSEEHETINIKIEDNESSEDISVKNISDMNAVKSQLNKCFIS
jgi:hypothetical protein